MSQDLYDGKPQEYYTSQRREMFPFVPAEASEVLEVGCGEAHFAEALRAERGLCVTAIEPYADAALKARPRVDRLLECSVEDGLDQLAGESFDCVVFNDVLEHLVDPWDVLERVHPLLRPGGKLVASLPNLRYMPVLKDLVLQRDFQYRDYGVLDRTHLRFFTQRSLRTMFESAGYKVDCVQGINGIKLPWKFNLLNRLTGGALDDTRYVQFACVAGHN